MTFVIFSLVACPVLMNMSKHSLVLVASFVAVVVGFVFFWGGEGGGRGCYVLFKKKGCFCCCFCCCFFFLSFFDGKSVMSALCTYYYMCMLV